MSYFILLIIIGIMIYSGYLSSKFDHYRDLFSGLEDAVDEITKVVDNDSKFFQELYDKLDSCKDEEFASYVRNLTIRRSLENADLIQSAHERIEKLG